MWKRSDIIEGKRYRVCLMYEGHRRYFQLLKLDDPEPVDNCYAMTEEVDPDLLIRRHFESMSKSVVLTTGERFYVDAHGIWLAQSEYDWMVDRNRGPIDRTDPSLWVTPEPPRFAPK